VATSEIELELTLEDVGSTPLDHDGLGSELSNIRVVAVKTVRDPKKLSPIGMIRPFQSRFISEESLAVLLSTYK
jgi:hypothetical protein